LWHGTELEEALPLVLSGLRRYEEKQAKLLFVITDGDTGSPDRTGRLIQEAREEGIVVIGIGVGVSERNLRRCFGRCKSFSQESLEKLPDYIAQEIEEAMASVNFSGY
jgi:Mg-chelatase subunit ChlD